MVAGRPRTTSPSEEEVTKIGEALLEWVHKDDKKEPHLRFAQFYAEHMHILRKVWKEIIQLEQFRPYYEEAQSVLARRCINGTMEKSFGQRFIRLYDYELTQEENETAKYNADLRKEIENSQKQIIIEAVNYATAKLTADKTPTQL